FEKLLAFSENFTYQSDFDESDIRNQIMTYFKVGCNFSPPNVIILDAGDPPSSDSAVHKCLKMYENEISIGNNDYINVVADEAIFRRGISFCKTNNKIKMILGQWHTSKDMMSTLITIFSGYGIFNMAGILGVRFLDKLEKGVDFRATSKVLELIWVAVGLAIHLYAKKKEQSLDDILEENKLIKIWYLYFQWASYWRAHWFGIRWGIFDLQHESLKAFSPLFPIAGKSNYARSVTHHIYCIENNSRLRAMLRVAPSVNLTNPGHFFAYDEALETFGVKFVKQNVTRIPTDSEELKLKIKATQLEKERTDMLICDYIGDYVQSSKPHNIQSRKEKIWELVHQLINAFESENPLKNPIFEFCNNLNNKGIDQLVAAGPRKIHIQWKHTRTRLSDNKFCAAIINKREVFCKCGQKVILDNDYDEKRLNEHSRNSRCKINNQKRQLGLPGLFPVLPNPKKVREDLEDSSPPPPPPSPPSFPNKPCPGLHSEQIVTYINRTPATYGGARRREVIGKEMFPNKFPNKLPFNSKKLNKEEITDFNQQMIVESEWFIDRLGKKN
ncbi:hypothetical protein RhiirA1_404310, partial [Rhizophagus irregularis]